MLAEGLLVLLVLTLGSSLADRIDKRETAIVRFKAMNHPAQPLGEQPKNERRAPVAKQSPPRKPSPDPPPPVPQKPPAEKPAQMIRLSTREMAAAEISALPRQAAPSPAANRAMMGPADPGGGAPDTPRVSGSGPNGEPLYAASWYREPTDAELGGYLSTAQGPGWGLIACRTAPDYRVEDCVKIDEYPAGSNIARSVLAAAWQFRVRPPRIGGVSKIGEWVRIRIDYDYVVRSNRSP